MTSDNAQPDSARTTSNRTGTDAGPDDDVLGGIHLADVPAETEQDKRKAMYKRLVIILASFVIAYFALRFFQRIQWSAVGNAMRQVAWWQFIILGVLLLIRQAFNASPLRRFIPGLTQAKAMQNDLGANLVGTVAPPPGDVVLRVAMFRSWGIHPVDGMTGVTLNMIVFYGARFIAPVLGLLVMIVVGLENHNWTTGLVSGAIAVVIIVGLLLILRSDTWAALLGRFAARVVSKMRANVDPEEWAEAVVDFRRRVSSVLNKNLFPALAGMVSGIVVDGLILLTALRCVGVGADQIRASEVFAAFLLAYPLTILPLFGLGALDAIIIASWVEIAGVEWESTLLGGTVVWRTVTLGGTLLLGAIATALWRKETRNNGKALLDADAAGAKAGTGTTEPGTGA